MASFFDGLFCAELGGAVYGLFVGELERKETRSSFFNFLLLFSFIINWDYRWGIGWRIGWGIGGGFRRGIGWELVGNKWDLKHLF